MNSKYRPILNPFTQLFKICSLIFFWGIIIYGTARLTNNPTTKIEVIAPGIFLLFFFGYTGFLLAYSIWLDLKIVTFRKDSIKIVYLLCFRTKEIYKNEIRGYSTCKFLNGWNTTSLILYTKDNQIVEFISVNYLFYKRLNNVISSEYCKIGEETLTPKIWIGRTYQFLE